MVDQKNKYDQVIKALECCRDFGDCSLCPYERATYGDELDCTENMHTDALALIIRQSAEIADLKDALYCEKETNAHLCGEYMSAKSEVAREIFEEIESVLFHTLIVPTVTAIGTIENKKIDGLHIRIEDYNTIKKKYTNN
jgi:hypothetical protein